MDRGSVSTTVHSGLSSFSVFIILSSFCFSLSFEVSVESLAKDPFLDDAFDGSTSIFDSSTAAGGFVIKELPLVLGKFAPE